MSRPELVTFTLWVAFGLGAGAILPVQAGINSRLGRALAQPVLATLCSFGIGLVALVIYTVAMRLPMPTWEQLRDVPPWAWLGGLLGAVYVLATVLLAPRLGAASLIGVIIAGQMLASLAIDHFGLVGFSVHPVNLGRLCGAVLLAAGVALLLRF